MQQASELKKVQSKLGVPRSSLGSLSEAATVFDSDLLIEIIGELASEVKPIPHSASLADIKAILTIAEIIVSGNKSCPNMSDYFKNARLVP